MSRRSWRVLTAGVAAVAAHAWSAPPPPRLAVACASASASFPSLLAACTASAPRRHPPRAPSIVCLNRLLLEPSECEEDPDGRLVARLSANDRRTEHVRRQLKAVSGQTVRAGVLDAGATDSAELQWEEPAAGGGAGESALRLELGRASTLLRPLADSRRPRVDLLLAMPRPLQFARLLPMLASMGVGTLWVTGARRVEKNYFSSHLLRADNAAALRETLVQGLEQSGDTAVPRVVICRELTRVLRDELPPHPPPQGPPACRLVCHPERPSSDAAASAAAAVSRLGQLDLPAGARVLLAVGPERGWEEGGAGDELALLAQHGFRPVTLGPRTLRTDVACVALIAVAHERLAAADAQRADDQRR